MSSGKRLRVWLAAGALVFSGCGSEAAKSPDPAAGEGSEGAGVTEATPAAASGSPAAGNSNSEAAAAPAGAGEAAGEKPDAPDKTAKPSAPIQVAAKIRPGEAELDVAFGSDGTGVSVKVWGTDGLKVKSAAEPVSGAAVTKGQVLKVSVTFDAPATQSNLAVGVNGTFNGKDQGKVQSFTVSPAAGASTTTKTSTSKEGSGEPAKDSSGRKVKVMKAP